MVQRITYVVKVGKQDEAVELLKAGADHLENVAPSRVYGHRFGPRDTVAIELEVENLAELERFWGEWQAAPETAAVVEKWDRLVEPGGTTEIWKLL